MIGSKKIFCYIKAMLDQIVKQTKEKMIKALEHFSAEISGIRTGRVSSSLVEDIKVDVYGSVMPIRSLATATVPDASTIIITPWDKSAITSIEKAIVNSGLGGTVANMGEYLRIGLPPLSEERRKEFQKLISSKAEETKVILRGARREAIELVKELEKKGELTEDDRFQGQKQLDGLIADFEKKVDEVQEEKNKELQVK